jgi:NAD-dependent deacetylase
LDDLSETDPERFLPCPSCGYRRLRPDIVWFGEVPYHLNQIAVTLAAATHFISIGTSGVVYPAAGFLSEARYRGAETWVNSLDAPDNLHPSDRFLPGRAAEVVPAQVESWLREWLA